LCAHLFENIWCKLTRMFMNNLDLQNLWSTDAIFYFTRTRKHTKRK
jgi:hypothetical protein